MSGEASVATAYFIILVILILTIKAASDRFLHHRVRVKGSVSGSLWWCLSGVICRKLLITARSS